MTFNNLMKYFKSNILLYFRSHQHAILHPDLDGLNLSVHFLYERVILSVAAGRKELFSLELESLEFCFWAFLRRGLQSRPSFTLICPACSRLSGLTEISRSVERLSSTCESSLRHPGRVVIDVLVLSLRGEWVDALLAVFVVLLALRV
jgi:hypothetical protein